MHKVLRVFLVILFSSSVSAYAGVGLSGGLGLPYVGQFGLDYKASSDWSFYAGYNTLSLSVGNASVELTMPEFLVRYHPFSKSFYLGVGVGQENLKASATDQTTTATASTEVTAMTGIAKLGWMWGAADNSGLWIGVDASYIMPFSPTSTITAPGVPTTDPAYQDVVDANEKFGKTAYINITFLRLGYLF